MSNTTTSATGVGFKPTHIIWRTGTTTASYTPEEEPKEKFHLFDPECPRCQVKGAEYLLYGEAKKVEIVYTCTHCNHKWRRVYALDYVKDGPKPYPPQNPNRRKK